MFGKGEDRTFSGALAHAVGLSESEMKDLAFAFEERRGKTERGPSRSDAVATDPEYSEVFNGECIVGTCTRPATVRVHEDFVLFALHHLYTSTPR